MAYLSKKLSAVIRAERIKQRYKSIDMARLTGMSKSFYSEVECGKRDVTMSRLESISKVFGLKPATLVSRADRLSFVNNEKVTVDIIDGE